MESVVAMPSGSSRTRRRPRLLPLVFLLSGSALALAFGAVDLVLAVAILDALPNVAAVILIAALIIGGPILAAIVPAMRRLEGVAAELLLDADLGAEPAPSRSRGQRLRTIGWFWLHLLTGAAAAIAFVFGIVFGIVGIIQVLTKPAGYAVLGIDPAVVRDGLPDLGLVAAGLALIIAGPFVIFGCVRLLARLAPILLGPTPQERIAALDARTSQLAERARLARELHDSVGHALSVIVLQTAVARRRINDPDTALAALAASEEAARTALDELDDVLGLLREDNIAPRAPARDLTALPELIKAARTETRTVRLADDVDLEQVTGGLPSVVSRECYRIIQEGVTNAVKHAPGAPVTIGLSRVDHELMIMISNPIDGPATRHPPMNRSGRRRRGSGVRGISERVAVLGGELTIEPGSTGIWQLVASIPLPRQNAGS